MASAAHPSVSSYYEGYVVKVELPPNVYRVDRQSGKIAIVAGDLNRPNGLCFNRLFMCGSTAMYALYVNTQGAPYF